MLLHRYLMTKNAQLKRQEIICDHVDKSTNQWAWQACAFLWGCCIIFNLFMVIESVSGVFNILEFNRMSYF
ncbi:hypothetical protein BCT69_20860 [Enterovibrio norvegicus]|nr:hypothetical protein BCT69_20860 [Enterovibrio norvegicus]